MIVRRFPFSIGRGPGCGLVLDDAGVWEQHLDLQNHRTELALTAAADAMVSVNGEPVRTSVLRNGDVIELGGVKLCFGFSPMRQRGLRFRETLTWLALAAICLGQVALVYLLSE